MAVFDLDGTLVPLPSLERRLFRTLRYRKAIPFKNYFLWLRESIRLLPGGIAILQANKMYLRGVQILDERDEEVGSDSSRHNAKGQVSSPPRRNLRLPVPRFFARAIDRVAWHVRRGHEIVLISGTLKPLAQAAARALEAELAARGIAVTIRVVATCLEQMNGTWTGRILGEPMFGEAKSRAAKRLAAEMRLDLNHCYAYGDSLQDCWLMESVGCPVAVNPSRDLASVALTNGWPVLNWVGEENAVRDNCVA